MKVRPREGLSHILWRGGLLVGSPHLSPDSNPWAPGPHPGPHHFCSACRSRPASCSWTLGWSLPVKKLPFKILDVYYMIIDIDTIWCMMILYYDIIWYMIYAIWYMIYAIWYMIWYMVYDICHYVWLCMHCVCIVYDYVWFFMISMLLAFIN
jgi:hypothetical protein